MAFSTQILIVPLATALLMHRPGGVLRRTREHASGGSGYAIATYAGGPLRGFALGLLIAYAPPLARAQARQCPRPGLAHLAQTVGRWQVTWRWGWGVDADSTVVRRASATIEFAADKCALLEQVTGTLRGRPLAIADMVTAPSTDTLQRAYVDFEHGAILLMSGQVRGDTMRFLWSKDLGDRQLLVRHEYFHITPTRFETRTWTSPNGGADWVLVQRASYRR